MNPEIERLFDAALGLPEDARAAFVESQEADPEVRREVLSLLLHDKLAETFFAREIRSEASSLIAAAELAEGLTIDAYRIVKMLGRGGMGAVYLAERADGCFEQHVALKVIQTSRPDDLLLDRFQQERSILAQLNHPNIAHLLDGGQTQEGSPYFVMEYVAGQRLDEFCDRTGASVRQRLELFLKVCDAVEYAHQNLIVHRDIKPANILVTAERQPKLLDFGVAKVLGSSGASVVAMSTRVLTPEYASPEQIRGESITTATDIYSLGAVLYHILSGHPPYDVGALSPLETAQAIAAAKFGPIEGISEELNAILRKALHKEPARRYASAGEFAKDVARFLEGRPVAAVPDSWGYRARKFLRRNWAAVATVAAVVTLLAVSTAVALWQARRAERRFRDVRRLANTFLFQFEDAIHNLSGATSARLLVVNTASEYLNGLAAEAAGDRQLLRELADAYKKLGDVQGNITAGNLGQFQQAAASYRKSLALRDALGDQGSSEAGVQADYLSNLVSLITIERFAGNPRTADGLRVKTKELADRWVRYSTKNADLLTAAAQAYADIAVAQRLREDFAAARANAKTNLDLLTRAYELEPTNIGRAKSLASGYVGAGYAELDAGKYAAAIDQFSRGNHLLDGALTTHPKDAALRRLRLVLLEKVGNATFDLRRREHGRVSDAIPFFEEAYAIGNDLAAEDPVNEGVQTDLAGLCQLYGSTLLTQGRAAQSWPLFERAIDIYVRQWKSVPGDVNAGFNLAVTRVWASDCRRDLHDLDGALDQTRMAAEAWDRLLALRPGTFRYLHQKADNLNTMGNLLMLRGDFVGAKACFGTGLEIAEKLPMQEAGYSTSVVINELKRSEQQLRERFK